MKPCFADTFFFLAWWNRRDFAHDRVLAFLGGYSGRLLTTRWVLMEVADGFASSRMRREVRRLFAEVEGDDLISMIELPGRSALHPVGFGRLPGRSAHIRERSGVLPERFGRLPGESEALPGRTVRLPERAERLPVPTDALPLRVEPLPGLADVLPEAVGGLPG